MAKLIGTAPNQVPTNGDLGSMAFEDRNNYVTKTNPIYQPYRNLIINGDMSIDQRNGGSSITPTTQTYGVDRWQNALNVSSKYSIQQVSDAPSGFVYSNKVTSLSAYSIGSGELAVLRQYVEGYNITKLDWGTSNAQTVTLSFWVKSSLTGDFGVTVGNDNGRTYGALYNISSANTWEKKSITIEGDTSGTWLTTNGKGISLVFALSTGSAFLMTADSWNASTSYGVTGQTQILATNSATWQFTGVQLEVGTSASDFEFLPYDVNYQRCLRYTYKNSADGINYKVFMLSYNETTTVFNAHMRFPVPMRASPSVTFDGNFRIYDIGSRAISSQTLPTITNFEISIQGTMSSSTAGYGGKYQSDNDNDAFILLDAEL